MATYVVGDVQGCFITLQKLLEFIDFDFSTDELIFLGDVINRGPNSLEMLRFIKKNDRSMAMVLGNHEIYAISLALDAVKVIRPHTLAPLLASNERDELVNFLRAQPLMIKRGNNVFLHAGILPAFSIDDALRYAHDISQILQSDNAKKFLERLYQKTPRRLEADMSPKKLLRLALASFTFIRMCEDELTMDFSYRGVLEKAPKKLFPWFSRRHDQERIFFGHWAALGLFRHNNYTCLDSGCVWGQELTALRLDDEKIFQVKNHENA